MKLNQDLTLTKAKEAYATISSGNLDYWTQFKGLTFQQFNEKIGMPINTKTKLRTKIYQYEDDLIRDTIQYRKIWVKKATGLGITEIYIRFIAWLCTKDDTFRDNKITIRPIAGTRPRGRNFKEDNKFQKEPRYTNMKMI